MKLKVFYDKNYKYSNRTIINTDNDSNFDIVNVKSFDGGNEIDTTIIFNATSKGIPTYLIVDDKESTFSNYRYFVSSHKFIRRGQWSLTLIRDILSEDDGWKTQPAYVENGYVFDKDNFLDFNRHKFNLNVIKKDQRFLSNDLSLVMFYQQRVKDGQLVDMNISESQVNIQNVIAKYGSLTEFPLNNYVDNEQVVSNYNNYVSFSYRIQPALSSGSYLGLFGYAGHIDTRNNYSTLTASSYSTSENVISRSNGWEGSGNTSGRIYSSDITGNSNAISNLLNQFNFENVSLSQINSFNNQIIRAGNNYYRVNCTTRTKSATSTQTISQSNVSSVIFPIAKQAMGGKGNLSSTGGTSSGIPVYYTQRFLSVTLTPVSASVYTATLPALSPQMDKIPVKALVIPNLNRNTYNQWVTWAVNTMTNNAEFIQAQLLPINITEGITQISTQSGNEVYHLWARDFSTQIPFSYEFDNEFVDKESRFVRLSSPSGASTLDITPYLNKGLKGFNLELSVKPFGTTIYFTPYFDGLYNKNFLDKRGLVIQEDFSISKIDSAWVQYKYQNQNYLNSFNREIRSVELSHYYASEGDRLALERADNEAKQLAREYTKSSWGMFDNLLLGIPSMIGGNTSNVRNQYNEAVALDTEMNASLRADNISLKTDLFNYSMANIKSIAPTLSKVDTFDILNYFSIIVEFYECSEAEKEYIINYYMHNGAVIGTIGTFEDYYGLVIKGKLIKSNKYNQLQFNEINKRLQGGIYTGINISTTYTNEYGETIDMLTKGGI